MTLPSNNALVVHQQGISLIELMVSIAIFAVGMLALLGLLSNSMVLTQSANHSSVASAMAYALADNIRANPSQIAAYNDPAVSAIEAACLTTAGCTKAQMVNAEYGMWQERLAEALPGGEGVVCRDSVTSSNDGTPDDWMCAGSATNTAYVVKICWKNTMNAGAWSCYRATI